MQIILNGEAYELDAKSSIADLCVRLQLEGKRFAVEVNREIIPRGEHATFMLKEQDHVEIVQAIGGG
ncbi:MAG: sulfur carrier protein ThiS [Oleiphilaceae bacterium]|nr:sulfur carrier protein ThiS [Oleiphilaceae bacterium]